MGEILIEIAKDVVVVIIGFILGKSWKQIKIKSLKVIKKLKKNKDTKEVRKILKDAKKGNKIWLKDEVNKYLSTGDFNYNLYKNLTTEKHLYGKKKKVLIKMQRNNEDDIKRNKISEYEQAKYMREIIEAAKAKITPNINI